MNKPYQSRDIFGSEVQYFRLEPRYWKPILEKLKDTGLTNVTTYVQWATHLVGPPDEQHPAGVLDFEGRTNPRLNLLQFLDLVSDLGLEMNFRCGPFCCNEMVHGAYPEWLIMGDPGMMVWDYQNRLTQGYWIARREGSQPSYLHPDYLAWCQKWIHEVDQIIQPRLKSNGGFITMVNLDNEVSYIVQDGFLTSDYNPVNVRPGGFYHQFLQEKYSEAGKLPYAEKYSSLEEVPAPRSVPDEVDGNFAYYADWCEFKTWVMVRYITELREMHESNGVKDVTFMTNFNPHRPEGIPTRMPDFEKATGPNGIAGYDFYRGSFMSYSGYQSMARVLKLMNATLRFTWSAEFMSGIWNKVLPSRISDDHMQFMAMCALAHGCKALSWFMFHDRDCWGDSPVSSHAHARPSLQVLKTIRQLACESILDWDNLVPAHDLLVVYDLASHQHTYLGDPSPCNDNAAYVGTPLIDGVEAGLASREYEGLFRVVEHAGRQAGVIDPVHSPNIPSTTPIVLLPGSPVLHQATIKALETYVGNGGKLIVSGAWPLRNHTGAKVSFLGGPPKTKRERIVCGDGVAWWVASGLGSGEPEEDAMEGVEWLSACLDREGPEPHARILPDEPVSWVDWNHGKAMKSEGGTVAYHQPRNLLSAILQESKKERILFLLNHYPEAARGKVSLSGPVPSELVDLESGEKIPFQDGVATVDIDRKAGRAYRVIGGAE